VIQDLISVIIPTYNHAHFLGDAIQSARKQSYRAIEIIVVDDGSTDQTRAVVERFGERVRYLWQEKRGRSGARPRMVDEIERYLVKLYASPISI